MTIRISFSKAVGCDYYINIIYFYLFILAPEIIDVSSKAEEVKIKTITRQKEKEAVYEKKQAIYEEKRVYIESMVEEPYDELEVEPYTEPFEEPYYEEPEEDYEEVKVQAKREVHEEWEEDYEEGQEYYVREEGYDEGEEEWEESYQEREAVQVQREVREGTDDPVNFPLFLMSAQLMVFSVLLARFAIKWWVRFLRLEVFKNLIYKISHFL